MTNSKVTLEFLQKIMEYSYPDVVLQNFKEAPGSKRGDNYTSMLYRVRLEGIERVRHSQTSSADDSYEEIHQVPWRRSIIYKCLPDSPARREAFKSDALFKNEVVFYNRILPAMLDFQKRMKGLAPDGISLQPFVAVPKCYLARNDIVVLEDLRDRGFNMADRKLGLNVAQCTIILKELAKFHALSLAMKAHCPENFKELISTVSEGMFTHENKEWYSGYYSAATKNALVMVREALTSADDRAIYLPRFRAFVEPRGGSSFFDRMVELVLPHEPLAVLCHGDCWTNNILFKSDAGKIQEMCFVDFQMVRYGSPALDLVYLLYCCTSRALRDRHLEGLLRGYTKELCGALKAAGPQIPDTLRDEEELWNMIQQEFLRCGRFGLGLAMDMVPILTCDSDEAPDLYVQHTDEEEGIDGMADGEARSLDSTNFPPSGNEQCRVKMAELVQELVDKGVL